MGISGLSKILKEYSKETNAIQEVNISHYSGFSLAVDVNIYLHGFAYNPTQKKPNSHIDGFFQIICDLLQHNVIPIMVLDGTPPEAKSETLQSRKDYRTDLQLKAEALTVEIDHLLFLAENSPEDLKQVALEIAEKQSELDKYVKRDIKIESSMYPDLIYLFSLMGIPCLQAKGESDALCVKLFQAGLVRGILSEDMDVLALGGNLIRGIKEKRIPTICEYNLQEILINMGFTQRQLVEFSILCGCDYAPKVKNVGPKTAIKFVKKHGDIETILSKELEPKLSQPKCKYDKENIEAFKKKFTEAREILLESPNQEDLTSHSIELGKLNKQTLISYLMEKCNYRLKTLEKKMSAIASSYS